MLLLTQRTCSHAVPFSGDRMRNNVPTGPTLVPMRKDLSVDIPRDVLAPASARRAVERLGGHLAADVLSDVKLLVSELITNSVKYGGQDSVTLRMRVDSPRRLRVEVVDQGSGFVPVARNRPVTEAGGWGLHLVQTLSSRWGVFEGSTHVWFELDREQVHAEGPPERAFRGTRPLSLAALPGRRRV